MSSRLIFRALLWGSFLLEIPKNVSHFLLGWGEGAVIPLMLKLLSLSLYLIMIISSYLLMDLCHILIDSFVYDLKLSSTQILFSILFNLISCLKKISSFILS